MKKITILIALMITSLGFAQPTTSAPVPTKLQADVVSVYSGSYTNIATNYNPNWGQSGAVNTTYDPGDGNVCMAYTNFNYQGTDLNNLTPTDLSAMEYLHVDVWTNKEPANFILQVTPVNSGPQEFLVTINHVQGQWYSVDIPKSAFIGQTWNNVFQMKFAANGAGSTPPGDIYLDNIYFWKGAPLGTSEFETSSVKMYPNPVKNTLTIDANSDIEKVSVFNILGQEVLKVSPKSKTATLQTNGLPKGVYMITTEIDGKVSTSKVVKE